MNFCLPVQEFVSYIPLIEKFLLSQNKQKFISSLPKQGTDFVFLQLCTSKLGWQNYKKNLDRLKLSTFNKTTLQKFQSYIILLDQTSPTSDRDKAIDLIKKQLKFNFNYPKPTIANYSIQNIKTPEYPSQIKPSNYSLQQYLKTNNYERSYQNLTQYGIQKLSKSQILNLQQKDFDYVLNYKNLSTTGDDGLDIIKKYFKIKRKSNKYYYFPFNALSNFTNQQLEKLPNYIDQVVNSRDYIYWKFKKSFGYELKSQFLSNDNYLLNKDQLFLKKQLLKKSIIWLNQFDLKIVSNFICQILVEILFINILRQETQLNLFFEYLKQPRQVTPQFKNQSKKKKTLDIFWYQAHQLQYDSWPKDVNLIQDYLSLYFKQNSDINDYKQFQKYFKRQFLLKLFYRIKLQKGETISNIHTIFSRDEEYDSKNTKQLIISKNNKKNFKIKESILIQLLVKNIQQVTAQIYQISTQNHYLNSKDQIDNEISLEFLYPLKKVIQKINNLNPFQINKIGFDMTNHLELKKSIYIIDFKGQGILSRAVVRRGSIVTFTKPTLAGIQLTFFQDHGKNIENLDIWLKGRKIHINQKYTIPYGQFSQQISVIVVQDGYAQLIKVTVPQQSYSWEISYIYHQENFLVGSKAKILIHADLRSSSQSVTTKALKNTKITVNILNHLSIPSTLLFDNINWDHMNQYELQIPIQSYLESIQISISAKLEKYVGKQQQLNSNKKIFFKQQIIDKISFVEFFLSFTNQQYILKLLGKNGEPKPFVNVPLYITTKLVNTQFLINTTTNKNGQIKLGKLQDVLFICIKNSQYPTKIPFNECSWNIDSIYNQVFYNQNMIINQGEKLCLPIYRGFKINNQTILSKVDNNSGVISDETDKLFLDNNKLCAYLSKGFYQLNFLALGSYKIFIEVIKLTKWGNSQRFIDNDTETIYQLPTIIKDPITISNDYLKYDGGDSYKINIKLEINEVSNLNDIKAHILASTFVYRNNYCEERSQSLMQSKQTSVLKLKKNNCSYLNSKQLSDEHCYVLNRQKQDKFIGNNLEKPRIILKRTFNQDTTVKKQELDIQKHFMRFQLKKKNKQAKGVGKGGKGVGKGGNGRRDRRTNRFLRRQSSYTNNTYHQGISLFNNFLKHPSFIIPNLHGEIIEFNLPKIYQSFIIIVASQSFAIQKRFSLDTIPLKTNNLINKGHKQLNNKQALSISRQSYKLQKGQVLKVKRSSQWTIVSGSNLVNLCRINGQQLFDWVINWPNYSYQKKLLVYDEYVCHQLNTYIKFKDPQFFQKVVKVFIFNKLQKTVVDYCLLQLQEARRFTKLQYYNKLNVFEKCLLVYFLVKDNKLTNANSIAKALSLQYKALKVPYSQFQNMFDIIITSNQNNNINREYDIRNNQNIEDEDEDENENENQNEIQFEDMNLLKQACFNNNQKIKQLALEERKRFKPGFQQIQKTKQYIETTYFEMKKQTNTTNYISISKFWVDLVQFFIKPQKQFLSQSFIFLSTKQQLALAASFLPLPFLAKYNLLTKKDLTSIQADSSFIVFVKEIKSMPFESKYGILINQTISDPSDQFVTQDDGTIYQKPIKQFIKDKTYCLNTVVTNTSTAFLQIQILIDIPEGSIPLASYENIQTFTQAINSHQTYSFQKIFYFPQSGIFEIYPANASKNHKVISKANCLQKIIVKNEKQKQTYQILDNVLASGHKTDILNFLQVINIFDQSIFTSSSILWLLKQKDMFNSIIKIFKQRSFYSSDVHQFGFYHKDHQTIKQFIQQSLNNSLLETNIFEYYPLSSQRVHKFMKEEKSTILNQTFKKIYEKFLVQSMIIKKINTPLFLATFIYYLLLQDRVKEASGVFQKLSQQKNDLNFPQIQYDYLKCFLDVYTGYPNFSIARQTSSKYLQYPVLTWRKLFKQVDLLLNTDNTMFDEDLNQYHDIKILTKGNKLRVLLPQKTSVQINFHAVNLQLMFSKSPFDEIKLFSSVKPFKTIVVSSQIAKEQIIDRPQEYSDIWVNSVQLTSIKQAQNINSFHWANDSLKIKVLQDQGIAIVFIDGKPKPGAYCKVYAKGKQSRFYKDGYSDIQGRFKYISELDDIQKFAIIFITQKGGIIEFARTPIRTGLLV